MDKARRIDVYHAHRFWNLSRAERQAVYVATEAVHGKAWDLLDLEIRITAMQNAVEETEREKASGV